MTARAAACRVALIGMMGSGKTTIGNLLAEATGWPYLDNDALVRRRYGSTARELLAEGGRARLREAEASALALGLELPPPVIIGVAAGTILEPENREMLRAGGIVVWLRAATATLIGRALDEEHRPFVDTAGSAWIVDAAIEREPLYRAAADLIVDTDTDPPMASVETIRAYLEGVSACSDDARTS